MFRFLKETCVGEYLIGSSWLLFEVNLKRQIKVSNSKHTEQLINVNQNMFKTR